MRLFMYSVFGIGESGVCQASRRVKEKFRNDKKTWKKNRKDREKDNYVKNEDLTLIFPFADKDKLPTH